LKFPRLVKTRRASQEAKGEFTSVHTHQFWERGQAAMIFFPLQQKSGKKLPPP
jgi:hypothetical protein